MDQLFSPAFAAAMLALAVLAGMLAFRPNQSAKDVQQRVDVYLGSQAARDAAPEVRGSFTERAVIPAWQGLLHRLGSLMPAKAVEALQVQLMLAGRPGNLTATDYLGLRVLGGAIGLGLGFLYASRMASDRRMLLFAPLIAALFGYMAPQSWLSGKIKARRAVIQRALPDALDMLTICVEAGLAFESSLQRVSQQWAGPLSDEFARVVSEIRLGVPRPQALRRLSGRCGVPDVSSFVAVLVQADSMGTSIALVLHSQAEQIRVLRRQRAEERANQAPIKVIMAMLVFIFPALFVVILGPAVPKVLEAFSGM